MAARKNTAHLQRTRDKIQTSQLITRLQNHALNKLSKPMTRDQIRAAEILLNKTLPNLQAMQLDVEMDGKLEISWEK